MIRSAVKGCGTTIKLPLKLVDLSRYDVGGMGGVAGKCIDNTHNCDCGGSLLNYN